MKKIVKILTMIMVITMILTMREIDRVLLPPRFSETEFFTIFEDPNFDLFDQCLVMKTAEAEERAMQNGDYQLSEEEIAEITRLCTKLKDKQRKVVAKKAELKSINQELLDAIACIYNRWKFFAEFGIEDRHWDADDAERIGPGAQLAWEIIVLREESNSIYQKLLILDPEAKTCDYLVTFMQSVSCPPVKPRSYPPKEDKPEPVSQPVFPKEIKIDVFYVKEKSSAYCPCMWIFDSDEHTNPNMTPVIECYVWSMLPQGITLADIEDVWLIGDFNYWVNGDSGGKPPTLDKLKTPDNQFYRIPRMTEDGRAIFIQGRDDALIKAMAHNKETRWLFALELHNGMMAWTTLENFSFDEERSWACGVFQQKTGAVMSLYPKSFQTTSRHRISNMKPMGE